MTDDKTRTSNDELIRQNEILIQISTTSKMRQIPSASSVPLCFKGFGFLFFSRAGRCSCWLQQIPTQFRAACSRQRPRRSPLTIYGWRD